MHSVHQSVAASLCYAPRRFPMVHSFNFLMFMSSTRESLQNLVTVSILPFFGGVQIDSNKQFLKDVQLR